MNDNFDLKTEIKKVEEQLRGKDKISTNDLAVVFNLCDKYIKNRLNVDILTIFEKSNCSALDVTKYIMLCLYSENELFNFISTLGLNELLTKTIYSMGDKKIIILDEDIINNSNKVPQQMPVPTDPNQIKRIFRALRRNYHLYEQLYKGKVWLINSESLDGDKIMSTRVRMSSYMFFHLMGFDYKNILNPNGKDRKGNSLEPNAREFAAIFPDSDQALKLLQEFGGSVNSQYELIELLLQNEERFLQAALDGKLSNSVNVDKIELKCYSFERMGYIQSASGMILFDKQLAIRLQHGDEVKHINTDIILLNDFLRKYKIFDNLFALDFVISPFDKTHTNQISDQQSIFLTRQDGGGFNSHIFDQQKASVSSSVAGYKEKDFNYTITELGGSGGNPPGNPDVFRKFSDDDRKRVAQTMIEAIPELDKRYLNEIVNEKEYER